MYESKEVAAQVTGESDGPPRAVLIAAAALAAAVIGVILVVAANRQPPERPVVIPAVPAPQGHRSRLQSTAGRRCLNDSASIGARPSRSRPLRCHGLAERGQTAHR
ncbi:conserved hypothetical protein [Mycobacterium tuberculosis GM 1503]|nr:conserved hypothetical protein [Mycobacterium tuberculosis GM 1503]